MENKQIIVVKPKSLSPKDKEKLTKAGNIVIEHEKADEVVFKIAPEAIPYVFINCAGCGDRVYLTQERLDALMLSGNDFYCNRGHRLSYPPGTKKQK